MTFLVKGDAPRTREVAGLPVISYIDEGWGSDRLGEVERALSSAMQVAVWNDGNPLYFIAFLWRDEDKPMVDLWRFTENPVDDTSGPLADMQVIGGQTRTHEFGVASGNTLLVLGLEELHRRTTANLDDYVSKPPKLPGELLRRV